MVYMTTSYTYDNGIHCPKLTLSASVQVTVVVLCVNMSVTGLPATYLVTGLKCVLLHGSKLKKGMH